MRRRLRKWLGIVAMWRQQKWILNRLETQAALIKNLQAELAAMQAAQPVVIKPSKPQPQQMANWSEFLRTVGQGEEINA